MIRIESSHFGNNNVKHDVHVSPNEIKLLAEMFKNAAAHQTDHKTYSCAALADKIRGIADKGAPPQGGNNLDFYSFAFVKDEVIEHRGNQTDQTMYQFGNAYVLEGSVYGVIYIKEHNVHTKFAVQTFHFFDRFLTLTNEFKLPNLSNPNLKVVAGKMDHLHGKLLLEWNGVPEATEVIVTYEYDMHKNHKAKLDALCLKDND